MKTVCPGGGSAGLYFAISMKLRDPSHQVTVIERNRDSDTFSWGGAVGRRAGPDAEKRPAKHAGHPRSLCLPGRYRGGARRCAHGVGRARVRGDRAQADADPAAGPRPRAGVDLRFETEFASAGDSRHDYDLVVAADGINSCIRREYADTFRPDIDLRKCKFVWLENRMCYPPEVFAAMRAARPERKNRMTFESSAELRDWFRSLPDDDTIKAVVFDPNGGNFSSGGDVHDIIGPLTRMTMKELLRFTRMTGDLVRAMAFTFGLQHRRPRGRSRPAVAPERCRMRGCRGPRRGPRPDRRSACRAVRGHAGERRCPKGASGSRQGRDHALQAFVLGQVLPGAAQNRHRENPEVPAEGNCG